MILLQAAIGASLFIFAVFGGLVFVGLPLLTYVIFIVLLNKESADIEKKKKWKILFKSTLIALISIVILLLLVILLFSLSWNSRIN